jgi:DNA-binding NarL/FixJ family response regulator
MSVVRPSPTTCIRSASRSCYGSAPQTSPLVVFSDNSNPREALSAFNVGVQGFLYTGMDVHLAQRVLSLIFDGGSCFAAAQRQGRLQSMPQGAGTCTNETMVREVAPCSAEKQGAAPALDADMTERQRAVLEHLGHGASNKTIARRLGIAEGTVKVHVRQIMRKLGVANRTQIAIACATGGA